VDSRFDAVGEHPSQQESDGAQDHDGGAHDCCTVPWNSANTKTTLRFLTGQRNYTRVTHTFTMPCTWMRLCVWISANLNQYESCWGGRSEPSAPSAVDRALTQQITRSHPDQNTLHMQQTPSTCRN